FGTNVEVPTRGEPDGHGRVIVTGAAPGAYAVSVRTYGKTPRSWVQDVDATGNESVDSSQIPSASPIHGVVAVDGQVAPTSAYVQLYNRAGHVNLVGQILAKGEFHIDSPEIKSGTMKFMCTTCRTRR